MEREYYLTVVTRHKTVADIPHDCQVEEDNFWLKKKTESSLKAIAETIKFVRKMAREISKQYDDDDDDEDFENSNLMY